MKRPERPHDVTTEDIKFALAIARSNIESGFEKYICNALPYDYVGDYLREFISYEISDSATLGEWVWKKIYESSNEPGAYPEDYQIREYRLRWIDYMMDQ